MLASYPRFSAALNSFNKVLLSNHIKTCVTRDIKEGKEETVDELVATLQKLMKQKTVIFDFSPESEVRKWNNIQ